MTVSLDFYEVACCVNYATSCFPSLGEDEEIVSFLLLSKVSLAEQFIIYGLTQFEGREGVRYQTLLAYP